MNAGFPGVLRSDYVQPHWRRNGIGAELLQRVADVASGMGYSRIYCATATADTLMLRCNWVLLDTVEHSGKTTRVYEKAL